MNSLVKKILLVLIGLVLIGTACFFLFFNKKSAGNDFKLEEASVQTTTTQEETTEKVELIASDPQKELEQVTGEQAETTKKMIQVMVDALEKAPNKQSIVPDRLNHDLSSYRRDLMIIKEKMILKYKYDASKTKVFKSNLDGTLQFTITFTDGKNILVYSGNYDTMTEQIQLATYREGE